MALIRNAYPGRPPQAAISHPPNAGPIIRAAAGLMNWSSEFAWLRSLSGTSCGTIASKAGPKNAVPAPKAAATIMMCHSSRTPASERTPRIATLTIRSASAAIITRRRSNRSLTTPPRSRKMICGRVIAMPTIERAVGVFDSS